MPASPEEIRNAILAMDADERWKLLNLEPEIDPAAGLLPPEIEDRQKNEPTPTRKQAETRDPTEDKYAATKWGGADYRDLEMPSGQMCLARRPGLQALVKAGILHDIDPIMPLIMGHEDRMAGREEQADFGRQIMQDPKKMDTVMHMIDRVVCHIVVKPQVVMTPNDITSRVDGVVYADMVELEDKMYLMNYAVGGAADVAKFRRELQEAVGDLDNEPISGSAPE